MGLILDTNILIQAERKPGSFRFGDYEAHGDLYLSAITASELLVGVHRANTTERRLKRLAFVESILSAIPTLAFDLETARLHASMIAALPKNLTASAFDSLIAATALRHGFAVLTANPVDFTLFPSLTVIAVQH